MKVQSLVEAGIVELALWCPCLNVQFGLQGMTLMRETVLDEGGVVWTCPECGSKAYTDAKGK